MTYTFKLARRLAILRHFVVLIVLALLSACVKDFTAPDGGSNSSLEHPASLQVFPRSVTIETSQRVQFRGQARTYRGEYSPTPFAWVASGGTINPGGVFSSSTPGTFKVTARGRGWKQTDTSVVIVVPPSNPVRITITPDRASLVTGTTRAFTATGYLADSSTVAVGVEWFATGGQVDPSGVYTAGPAGGSYRLIATNTAGTLADTAILTISVPTSPTPTLASVVVSPTTASLTSGASKQFKAFGRNSAGDSVAVVASFSATGGTVTSGGFFTAGSSPGTFRVIAKSGSFADTGTVTVAVAAAPTSSSTGSGLFFGPYNLYGGGAAGPASWDTPLPGTEPFTLSMDYLSPDGVLKRIASARERHLKLLTTMTGGSHDRFKTNGVFDMGKWMAVMDGYNTPTIKSAVAAAVLDGTIIGNVVMDEPNNTSATNSWGPTGTMTKARVDSMCGYVKQIFPTLPAGVVHPHTVFQPDKNYAVCDFLLSQYEWGMTRGDVAAFRDGGLAWAQRSHVAILFSLNILDGGIPSTVAPCAFGTGTYGVRCRMSPTQVRDWGLALGPAGCGLTMWRYDSAFMANPDNQRAFRDVGARMATLPGIACRRQ